MKKILAVVLCLLVLLPSCIPFAAAKKEEETEIEFTLDFNQRYTDIVEVSDGDVLENVANKAKDENTESKRIVYIAVLVTAFVISLIVLIVTLKRVPDEENVDISGTGKKRKSDDIDETENNEE